MNTLISTKRADSEARLRATLAGIVLVTCAFGFLAAKHLTAQDEPMPYAPGAFGVWGWDWLTAGGDAQRSSSVRNDRWISRATVTKPGPRLVYKIALPNTPRQMNSLSQPILLQTARGLTGFKSMGFVTGSGGTAFGFDYDTSQVLWKTPLGAAAGQGSGTLACPGGLTTGLARPTPLAIANVTDSEAGRGVAPGNLPGARKSGTAVGTPGEGAPIVDALQKAPMGTGRGGGAGGSGRGGGGFGGGGGRGASGVFALGADGMLHQLSMQQGFDVSMQPVNFLPPNANASGLILVDNVAYAATSNNCGGVPNGVWSLELATKAVTTWKTNGGSIAGSAGAAFGADGTLYAATADGDYTPASYSDSVVSLEPKTLKLRDYFTPGKSEFNSSPVVFSYRGRDLLAASNRDGRLYLLDGAALGGADHRTPLSTSAKFTDNATDYAPGALTSWMDSGGTRWVLAPMAGTLAAGSGFANANGAITNGTVVAFKVADQGGKPVLTPAWASRDLVSPATPVVVNGVVFALSSGEFHSGDSSVTATQRAQRSQPAVLYALDAFTGKELWNSGKTIMSFSPHSAGLAVSTGQIYIVTYDSTVYAFGFEEKD
jgi:hypothetical protein